MPETNALKSTIEKILKSIPSLVTESGELKINKIKQDVENASPEILEALLKNKSVKRAFFAPVLDSFVFKTREFKEFLDFSFACNSYSKYLGRRIGLYFGDEELTDRGEVVLNFPFKDCVLEGGQTKEDGQDVFYKWNEKQSAFEEGKAKRKEIFYNQVLAQDEIDSLFSPKAFSNAKLYDKNGESVCTKLNRDAEINKKRGLSEDTITDNLVIKGNNLLALHSLKEEFAGKVKLIYIDPPYNTGSDSFSYNDNFNHSSWLTFMKNRLEVARELLRDDGALFIQIDHHELAYSMVLVDEIFGIENKVQVISVKAASVSGFKAVNPGPIDVTEYILFYTKNKHSFEFKKNYVEMGYNKNYNKYLDKKDSDDVRKWKFIPIKEKLLSEIDKTEKEMKQQFGDAFQIVLEQMTAQYAFDNADSVVSIRDLHKPTPKMKELQDKSRITRDTIFTHEKTNGEKTYLINGGAVAFYSAKIHELDGKKCVTELLSDFWDDISWAGIATEGGIKLKNAKKPEKLLKRIVKMATEQGDIVLDYHLGSGTTAAVAHKMNRQYIGVEQMDYVETITIERLKKVIDGEQGGISKSANWTGGGSFVYCELAQKNEKAISLINECENYDELVSIFDELCTKYFLHYNVQVKKFHDEITTSPQFKSLPLEKQKEMFCRMLDLNQLYVNHSERNDKSNGLTKNDIAFTEDFYSNLKDGE